MAITLRASEAPAAGLRRVFLEHVRTARRLVGVSNELADDDLHEARRALKRARATLRLLRPALDRQRFAAANLGLRDAGRPLTHARDARVLLDTLARIAKHLDDPAASALLPALKRTLQAEHRGQRRALESDAAILAGVRHQLAQVERAASGWALARDEWPLLSHALHRIYRDARRAGTVAGESPSNDNLHEWRKQVKHLDHALDLLRDARPGRLGVLFDEAHRIAGCLGDDHDLAVLAARLATKPARASGHAALKAAIDARRIELQDRATTLAEHLFAQRPTAFVDSIEKPWKAWRRKRSRSVPS